jgi:hypothetical protein
VLKLFLEQGHEFAGGVKDFVLGAGDVNDEGKYIRVNLTLDKTKQGHTEN